MKILVTGNDGYLGSLLAPTLIGRGHDITGVDTGFFRNGWLYNSIQQLAPTYNKDTRSLTVDNLRGYDAIVHLAELSNDPLGQLAPHITFEINHQGSVKLAQLAKQAGIARFVYFSSCSVYGASATRHSDESAPTEPLTAYAQCKLLVERDVSALADDNFSPTFLRNATAYGPSPRLRFDLVVNNLAGWAWTAKEIRMESDGTPWRPLVHALDICQAAACVLEAPRQTIHNEIFNVGSNSENYQIKEVARIIGETFPGCQVSMGSRGGDRRDYRVSFDKIHATLPTFKTQHTVASGAAQFLRLFERVQLTADVFQSPAHTRLKQIQYLLSTGQIDENFFWKHNEDLVCPAPEPKRAPEPAPRTEPAGVLVG